ncbi:MAG: ABC transporter ATP-binding protein [Chloroflexi bacterium]|nr:ABC transporter ATP-binding protein [Chloroflexota bacterium]
MDIVVQDLTFRYAPDVIALRDVSLIIPAGEQVAIIGENGAGKTTLAKHFNGLLKPTQGSVSVGGRDTRDLTVAQMARWVGYVFQNPDEQLFRSRVADEVAFGPYNLGYDRGRSVRLVDESLSAVGLREVADLHPHDLIPSQRRLVAIACVLAMDTPSIVFDEPTTGQDHASVLRLSEVIASLKAKGKTVITISHDIDFCAETFDRIIVMGQGRVLLDGPPESIFGRPDVLAQTSVEPPQMTRLGIRVGLPTVVYTVEGFLSGYQAGLSVKGTG